MKRLLAILLALCFVPVTTVFATDEVVTETEKFEQSVEYQAYEQIAGYIADMYLDDSYTAQDIMEIGLSEYLGKMGDEALVQLLKGALQSLDEYSDFYTRSEYIEYNNALNKTFYGLGIQLQQMGEYVQIVDFVEENGLAEQSGFKVGDMIVAVGGINVIGSSVTEVRNLVVGELGTTVVITVLRDGKNIDITGVRTAVNSTTVSGVVLKGNIGYIKIASFSEDTAQEFREISAQMQADGIEKVIIDLRDNLGGIVSAAVEIAEEIVPAGKIVDVVFRDEKKNYSCFSELETPPFDIVVLVNEDTASSSEILASAIQDSGVGILIGETTYGKAVIQSTYSLQNGMVFKLTVGQYITRNGNEIANIGLEPDREVSNYTKKIDTTGYTKFDFLTPTKLGDSGVNVTAAKERLALMNYYIGNMTNDVFNTDLKEAIREFQKRNGLTDSGALDVPTQIAIKEVFESLLTEVDVQLQTAYMHFGGSIDDLYKD